MPCLKQNKDLCGTFNFVNGIKIEDVPGVTVNRYCASGLETIGMATAKIQSGMAHCIAGGLKA
jgi:acetyl-CoA acetyltransferase